MSIATLVVETVSATGTIIGLVVAIMALVKKD